MAGTRRRSMMLDKFRADEIRVKKLIVGGDPANEAVGSETGVKMLAGATITVGTESTNVINVAIQLEDGSGADMAHACYLPFYLSSDDAGLVVESSGADSIAIGTDGAIIADGGDSVISGVLISEADGDIDLDITHVGADTFYLNLPMPDGSIVTSDAITFDAST